MTHTPTQQRISARDLADQLAGQRVRVIDVREPMETAAGPIAGSLNVPLSRISQADLPRGPLVLVCQSGNRSARALAQLLQQGYPHHLSQISRRAATAASAAPRAFRMENRHGDEAA